MVLFSKVCSIVKEFGLAVDTAHAVRHGAPMSREATVRQSAWREQMSGPRRDPLGEDSAPQG